MTTPTAEPRAVVQDNTPAPARNPDAAEAQPSRRELNRQATLAAIVDAVLEIAESTEWSNVTVDRVAEAAGVSRRTFFNYFHSLEEALHEPLRALVAAAADRMRSQESVATDALTHLSETLTEVLSLELLAPTARVLLLVRDNPDLREAGLRTWDDCVRALIPGPGEGTPALRLYLSTLTRSAIGVAQSAFEAWAEELDGNVDHRQVVRLQNHIGNAISLLRSGFAVPSWLTEADLASCPPIPTLRPLA